MHEKTYNVISVVISTYLYFLSRFISVSVQARDIFLTHSGHQLGKSTTLSYSFSLSCPFPLLVSCGTIPKTLLHHNVFCNISKILILILLLYLKTDLLLFHFSPRKPKSKGILFLAENQFKGQETRASELNPVNILFSVQVMSWEQFSYF